MGKTGGKNWWEKLDGKYWMEILERNTGEEKLVEKLEGNTGEENWRGNNG